MSTRCEPSLLHRLREVLSGADEALLCVAFVSIEGVQLLRKQLEAVPRARLLSTTVFGSTTPSALDLAVGLGVDVRILNPSSGTYHPKLYLARGGGQTSAVVGSANLTSGLVSNVEVCTVIDGDHDHLADAWRIGEELWDDPKTTIWKGAVPDEPEWDDVLSDLDMLIPAGSVVFTLGPHPRANWVERIDASGVWIETDRSRLQGRGGQLVETWMLRLARDYLAFHGSLTNRFLVADDGLNVKRSSAVCALLAQLPEVEVASRNPIELRWTGSPLATLGGL